MIVNCRLLSNKIDCLEIIMKYLPKTTSNNIILGPFLSIKIASALQPSPSKQIKKVITEKDVSVDDEHCGRDGYEVDFRDKFI